jgi:hypothetical protein
LPHVHLPRPRSSKPPDHELQETAEVFQIISASSDWSSAPARPTRRPLTRLRSSNGCGPARRARRSRRDRCRPSTCRALDHARRAYLPCMPHATRLERAHIKFSFESNCLGEQQARTWRSNAGRCSHHPRVRSMAGGRRARPAGPHPDRPVGRAPWLTVSWRPDRSPGPGAARLGVEPPGTANRWRCPRERRIPGRGEHLAMGLLASDRPQRGAVPT